MNRTNNISPARDKSAFSLVELSIVLVILGLLVGGVLSGQSLIRAAELRSVSTDLQRYNSAMYAFRDKYFALPGDMNNATQFWTAQDAAPATCKTTASSGKATCDGNGNGVIDDAVGSAEHFRFWQQLANAGLIEGQYIGVGANSNTGYAKPGVSVPRSRISSGGFAMQHSGNLTGSPHYFDGDYSNFVRFGADDSVGYLNSPVLNPQEMWNVDSKLDDARPAYGKIRPFKSPVNANCTTTDVASTADYDFSRTDKTCLLMFITGL